MVKHIAAISFIYLCVCLAWVFLGNTVISRTYTQDENLSSKVEQLWGAKQVQQAPVFTSSSAAVGDPASDGSSTAAKSSVLKISGSDIKVDLQVVQRKKGLLWYPTYRVSFAGNYKVINQADEAREVICRFALPTQGSVYDNLGVSIGKKPLTDIAPQDGQITAKTILAPHEATTVAVSYQSQGMYGWRYAFPSGINQVKDFLLRMNTDFANIDFPAGTRSPTTKKRTDKGWSIEWKYDNTMTAQGIGMTMPQLLNPGPWVSEVTFFAPVSLFFFFFVTWLITAVRNVRIHAMHYFFIGAAFFSFNLLLAYLVDHVPVEFAFFIAAVVSLSLIWSYLRRAIPDRKFFVQIGLAQLVYQIFFSYTFFLEEFTGLIITCLSVITLFLSMQYTARFDWNTVFSKKQLAVEDPLTLIDQAYGA